MSTYLYKDSVNGLYVFKHNGFTFNPKPGTMMLIERGEDGYINFNGVYGNMPFRQNTNGHILPDFIAPDDLLDENGDARPGPDVLESIRVELFDFFVDAPEAGGAITVTYNELTALISDSKLVVGQKYIISDYQTVHNIPNALDDGDPVVNEGEIEPLMVTAVKTNAIANECYSTLFPQDVIYYDIESNQAMVPGCTKGYIYRRIDTLKNNDIGFDYRNVKLRRWKMDVTTTDTDGAQSDYTKGNVVKKTGTNEVYIKLNDKEGVPFTNTDDWKRYEFNNLSYIIPQEDDWYLIDADFSVLIPNSGMYFDFYMFSTESNTSGVQSGYDNIFKNKFDGNNLSIITASNTVFFGNNFYSNTIGNNFYSNTIGNDFFSNTIGNNFNYNTTGNGFGSNTIGNDFNNNTIGNNFYSNTIGNGFGSNTIGSNFNFNTIGNGFGSNTIGNGFNSDGGMDFTSATYVYQQYNKELFTNSENEQYLKYYDGDNVLQIVLANA